MAANDPLKKEICIQWLRKWPDIPTLQLARMIYNSDDNHKIFKDIENVRDSLRYWRGAHGHQLRKDLGTQEFIRPFKTIIHEL